MDQHSSVCNSVQIEGCLSERFALRFTPAKVPVVGFLIQHESRQIEAEVKRSVNVELEACAVGSLAHQINVLPLGCGLMLEGFLAAKSPRRKTPVFHVTKIELLEGMNNGFQTS